MIALHVVLWNSVIVLDPLLCQVVCGVGLLKQGIPDIFFISQDFADGAGVPFFMGSVV